uniref:mRNA-decapping enzyme 2 n=1 Tax=Panagrellus redivivus TaxID=6233 RepID=A0A7E4UNW0_PANRE
MGKQRARKNIIVRPPHVIPDVHNEVVIPKEILDDICSRFVMSLPDELKRDNIRVCFEVELAFWFFLDNYCDPSVSNVTNKQHRRDFASFCRAMFEHVDFLRPKLPHLSQILNEFRTYKSSIPVMGAIILDRTLNYVLAVQGYYSPKGSWGFPKGKMNEKESPAKCAIREVKEEIGFDISSRLDPRLRLRRTVNLTPTTLYIITDVDIDTKFQPETECEIRQIQWCSLWDLPTTRTDRESAAKFSARPSSFFTIAPFIENVQEFARYEQFVRRQQAHGIYNYLPSADYFEFFTSNKTPVRSNVPSESLRSRIATPSIDPRPSSAASSGAMNFTGESFMKLFQAPTPSSFAPGLPPSGSNQLLPQEPPHDLELTILMYSIPGREIDEPSPVGSSEPLSAEVPTSAEVDNTNDSDAVSVSTNVQNSIHNNNQPDENKNMPAQTIANSTYETMLKLNQTEELCFSTSESVLRTPAETRIFPEHGPLPPASATSGLDSTAEDIQLTPRSTRSSGFRRSFPSRTKKQDGTKLSLSMPTDTTNSANQIEASQGPVTPQRLFDQGISINVLELLASVATTDHSAFPAVPESAPYATDLSVDSESVAAPHRPHSSSAEPQNELGFVPVSPARAPSALRVGSQVVSETSAFTLVKPTPTTVSNSSSSTLFNPTPINIANFLRNDPPRLEMPAAWTNFKLNTDRLIQAYDHSILEGLEGTLI